MCGLEILEELDEPYCPECGATLEVELVEQ